MVEVSQAAFLCLMMTVVAWLIFYLGVRAMAKQQAKALTYPDDGILEIAIQKIRKWHFGFLSLATCFVPAAVLWLSLVIVSIARDNGVVIIPWFIWIPFLLFGILNIYTQKIRANAIRTILESVANGRTNKPMHPSGGSAVP
jgi:hypothetical protein